jgi:hypothetical protein
MTQSPTVQGRRSESGVRLEPLLPALFLRRLHCLLSTLSHCCPPSHGVMAGVAYQWRRESTHTALGLLQHNEKNSDSTCRGVYARVCCIALRCDDCATRSDDCTHDDAMLTHRARIAGVTNHSIKQWFLACMVSACARAAQEISIAMREWLRGLHVVNRFAHRPKIFFHRLPIGTLATTGIDQKRANQ